MIYTFREAHLERIPDLHIGSVIRRGDIIGRMGNTGTSYGAHLHGDCVEGLQTDRYSLNDIATGIKVASPLQLNYFIDDELFGIAPEITTYYADYRYQLKFKKLHLAYDLVPKDRHETTAHYDIHWNRSVPGRVTAIFNDTTGFGIHVLIAFEV